MFVFTKALGFLLCKESKPVRAPTENEYYMQEYINKKYAGIGGAPPKKTGLTLCGLGPTFVMYI